jgi:zinc transporter, ZIP family
VSSTQILVLGLVAGATIFIGLPLGRIARAGSGLRAFLSAISIGILLFLFWDVVAGAVEPIESSLTDAVDGAGAWSDFAANTIAAVVGISIALLGLVAYDRWLAARPRPGRAEAASDASPRVDVAPKSPAATGAQLALLIAVGIGLHNFAEGLAIGQSAAAGEIAFALVLMIGFALHNATEGFGIVAPLAGQSERPSWGFLGLLGVIGGGPTLVGTLVGQIWVNTLVSIAFLSLAAGSILYVIIELVGMSRSFGLKTIVTLGILTGLFLGFGTDFVLVALGG